MQPRIRPSQWVDVQVDGESNPRRLMAFVRRPARPMFTLSAEGTAQEVITEYVFRYSAAKSIPLSSALSLDSRGETIGGKRTTIDGYPIETIAELPYPRQRWIVASVRRVGLQVEQ